MEKAAEGVIKAGNDWERALEAEKRRDVQRLMSTMVLLLCGRL